MAHYLDPKNDLTFKRIFGEHEDLCMSLLNSMLPLERDRRIVSLKYQSPELIPEIPVLKDSIVDVCCTDNEGRQFIVEMQIRWTNSFKRRVLLNASKAYVRQLDAGGDYRLIQPVYALNFVNDIFDPDPNIFYHDYKIVNIENVEKQIEGLELVFIELPKFRPVNRAEKKLYDLWLTFLTKIREGSESVPEELLRESVTRDAVKYLERHSYTKAELLAYDQYLDAVLISRTFVADAIAEGEEKGIMKGMEIGKAKGVEIGEEKGLVKGIEIGRAEGKAEGKRELVITGHQNGLSIEQLQTFFHLGREQIEEILHSKQ
ncbi:MAG: Rpn family recombination-promoting nuclease/putative transposase [Tannerella sp.]|jgi:predicted transposase/invertase (TIGR01784 family)|nr:Rpn family recombination-promoting nuclease/putative transposase [Tannerella sp.]